MAASAKQILRYLRECYRENGSRGGLWNFFAGSVSHRVFLEDSDFLASRPDAEDSHYLRYSSAETTAKQAELYRKEKDLVYASVFLLGWVERFESKPEPICAPIFLYPATLSTDGLKQGASLRIDPDRRQVNYAVLEAVGGADFAKALEDSLEPSAISEGCVGEVRRRVAELFPDSETEPLLNYPGLIDGPLLRERFEAIEKDPASPFLLLPAAGIALINKSTEMRGVLNELDTMAAAGTRVSASVKTLLGESPGPVITATSGRVPATLSHSQDKVLQSARKHPLTLAVGPPGTGKSFTIAALAIETLSRGESVLIASKMDHAVDVVGNKIESTIGLEGVVTRGGRSQYLRQLKQFIDDLLSGIHTTGAPDKSSLIESRRTLQNLERRILKTTAHLARRLEREQTWGELLSDPHPGFFRRFRQKRLRKKLEKHSPIWEEAAALESLIDQRHDDTVAYLQASRIHFLAQCLLKDRKSLQHFSRAIRARTGTRQASYFEQMGLRRLLGALPVWMVNLSDVHRVLPLESAAFDLAIIDEATQCDMASAMPILHRARRVVITGDPKQLRHLSFLPKARQRAIADQFGLDESQRESFDFREISLLDLVSEAIDNQDQVAFLNEHFRSQPEIIAFSNREFYGGKLHVMTGYRRPDGAPVRPLHLERLSGAHREKNGTNPVEANAVIAAVEEVRQAQADLPAKSVHSIGILSPFRDQVDHLRRKIGRHPQGAELLERHDLLIGTAHSFQGEERDLMFLSLALDDDSPATSFRFLEKPDIFNVSITRARLLNRIWCSFDPGLRDGGSLLARYLIEAENGSCDGDGELPHAESAAQRSHDQFATEVAAVLTAAGAEVRLSHPLAGMEVDLIYTLDGITRGIDLIGYPGSLAEAFPLERVLTFRRAGLPILPLPFSTWLCHREQCERWLVGNFQDQRKATSTRT
ncbi:MAG: PhoH family protein [Verrucomicrobiae bacterium]|nr:PhoH family protein [Verrucomicrobiae bacterium]